MNGEWATVVERLEEVMDLLTVAEKNLSRMDATVSEIRHGYAEGHARTAKALADIREVLAPMVQP